MSIEAPVMQAANTAKPAAAPRVPRPAWLPPLLACCLSAALLWACYFPLAWGWLLGWVALVPLLTLVRSEARPRTLYLSAYLGGVLFFAAALSWMGVADPRMYILCAMLSCYSACYFPVGLALMRWLVRRWSLPLVVAAPTVWIALEYLRSWVLTGFGWYFLGHTQQAFLTMIQVADLGGVFAVSFLVACVNALVCDVLYQVPALRAALRLTEPTPWERYSSLELLNRGPFVELAFRRNLILEALAVMLLIGSAYVYGQWRLSQSHFEAGPTVALLQGNLDQRLRNLAAQGGDARQITAKHFAELCNQAVTFPTPDLIVWPETSYPQDWIAVANDLPIPQVPTVWRDAEVEVRDHFKLVARTCPTFHLLGLTTNYLDAGARHRRYNSALLLGPTGRVEERFDKMHRLPFGEYVPLRDWLPFMERFAPYDFDYSISQGEKFTRFALGPYRFGVLICYEDSDPYLARHYAISEPDGAPVDFLVNISNDGWFDGSSEHDEHLAVSRFRAIECRRALARSVNMGISAVIDGNGRVLQPQLVKTDTEEPPVWSIGADPTQSAADLPTAAWAGFKKTALVLKAVIPLDRRSSVYARYGDVLPIACWAGLGAAVILGCIRRRRAVS
jgi:apolipoprotein N-acyltransferase